MSLRLGIKIMRKHPDQQHPNDQLELKWEKSHQVLIIPLPLKLTQLFLGILRLIP